MWRRRRPPFEKRGKGRERLRGTLKSKIKRDGQKVFYGRMQRPSAARATYFHLAKPSKKSSFYAP